VGRGYGFADRDRGIRNGPETRFLVGSVSKMFTRLAIQQLAEQGRLALHDHLSKFIPDFPAADRITIEQLLDHRAGVPDLNADPAYDSLAQQAWTLGEVLALSRARDLEFHPGTRSSYSNTGYTLLAAVIERASGEAYPSYIERRIARPARLGATAHASGLERAGIAHGYMPRLDSLGIVDALPVDPSIKIGGGSLASTTLDLWAFDRAYRAGRLSRTTAPLYNEGITGRLPGFGSVVWSDGNLFVVVLSNNYSPVATSLALAIIRAARGDVVAPWIPPRHEPAPRDLLNAAGTFLVGDDSIRFEAHGTTLSRITNGDRWRGTRLLAVAPGEFYDPWEGGTFTFSGDGSAPATTVSWRRRPDAEAVKGRRIEP
jgi:CubicO group peptidase (beta-lactamase class C family)